MGLVQVIIDRTTSMVIQGVYEFDRVDGGILVAPSGTSFPLSPVAGEWFWRTDLTALYRRNDANSAWEAVSATVSTDSLKSGVVTSGTFAGNPKKATVTFASAFGASYAVTFSAVTDGTRTFSPSAESKSSSGFTLNLNSSNTTGLVEVGWHAILTGG